LIFTFGVFSTTYLFFFHIGNAKSRKLLKPFLPAIPTQSNVKRIIILAKTFALVYVATWSISRFVYSEDIGQFFFGFYNRPVDIQSAFLRYFVRAGFPLCIASLLVWRLTTRMRRGGVDFLFWIVWLSLFSLSFASGVRGLLLQLAIVIFLSEAIASTRDKSYQVRKWMIASIFFLSAGTVLLLGPVRHDLVSTPSELVQTVAEQFDPVYSNREVLRRSVSMNDHIAFIFQYYEAGNFHYFTSFYAIAVNLIPRALWPEKPVGFGKQLAWLQGYSKENPTSVAAGIAGEGYANGGWLGLILLSLLVGAFCGLCAGVAFWGFRNGNILDIFLSLLFFAPSISFIRGDMLTAWGTTVYPLIAVLLLLVALRFLVLRRR
jgi:hypothetical protein